MGEAILREREALSDQTWDARWAGRERTAVVVGIALASFSLITGVRLP
jgi:hypothetical protein